MTCADTSLDVATLGADDGLHTSPEPAACSDDEVILHLLPLLLDV